jgi:hypothetical protein
LLSSDPWPWDLYGGCLIEWAKPEEAVVQGLCQARQFSEKITTAQPPCQGHAAKYWVRRSLAAEEDVAPFEAVYVYILTSATVSQ